MPSPDGSRWCPGVHRVRLSLRTDSFYDEMVEYIDVGIVVAAERFSLILFEEAAEHMDNCIVRIVTTRGGGGVNDMNMSMAAAAAPFAKAIDKVVNRNASNDIFTRVGHTTPIHPSSLSVKGKKMGKARVGAPDAGRWIGVKFCLPGGPGRGRPGQSGPSDRPTVRPIRFELARSGSAGPCPGHRSVEFCAPPMRAGG